jgi:hypothetical protein
VFLDDARRLARIGLVLDEIVRMAREAELTRQGRLPEWTAYQLLLPVDFKGVCGGHVPSSVPSHTPCYSLYRQIVLAQRDWDAFLTKGFTNKYRPIAKEWKRAQECFFFQPFSEYKDVDGKSLDCSSENEALPDLDAFSTGECRASFVLTRISLALKEVRIRLRMPKASGYSTHEEYLRGLTADAYLAPIAVQGKMHMAALGLADGGGSMPLYVSFLTLAVLARRTYRDFMSKSGSSYPSQSIISCCAKPVANGELRMQLYDNPVCDMLCSDNESEWEDVDGLDGASWTDAPAIYLEGEKDLEDEKDTCAEPTAEAMCAVSDMM